MNQDSPTDLRVTGDRRLAEEWELVLLAQGLSPSLRRTAEGFALSVPDAELERGRAGLMAYDQENRQEITHRVESVDLESFIAGVAVGLLLLLFYSITAQWLPAWPWYPRGAADAEAIVHGELWRTVTALTLHADISHVLSNAVAISFFLSAVASFVGVGVGGLLVLLAGAGGNLANAYLHGASHVSVGASTAVFAAVGLLASFAVTMRRPRVPSRWRPWRPVAAALALLGMLGSSGQRVDIWAHLLGLLAGAGFGVAIGSVSSRAARLPIQWLCGTAAIAVTILCWAVALH